MLPFSHLGEANGPESFAGGLTEELMTQLGRLCADRLGVIARSSCHRVQRADRTVREIGEALRAHYLVEGTVRTESRSRAHHRAAHRSARRDAAVGRILRAAAVATACSCSPTSRRRSSGRSPWSCCPTARQRRRPARATSTPIRATSRAAITGTGPATKACASASPSTTQALTLDPGFATAHGAHGARHGGRGRVLRPRAARGVRRGRGVRRARAGDRSDRVGSARRRWPKSADARDWDWDGAEEAFRRALTFNPSNEGARRLYGVLLGVARPARARPSR